ncbi:MAG TPA: exodeoxyribonuclease III [Methylococcaceae bacterium]|nr:exodeoxyribonuclease III [Methylococcaceae bacterium]
MRIITFNANGIRSAQRKGFFTWLAKQEADIVCIQETKAHVAQLDETLFFPAPYHCFYHDAQKKGYSGVALYCKEKPDHLIVGMGDTDIDAEGRYIEAQWGNLSVVSLYLPSGSSGEVRQQFKYEVLEKLRLHLKKMADRGRDVVICGDWNIAHQAIDLKNWRGNQKNSGFLPEERAWMDALLQDDQWVDAFRVINQDAEQYTWWSNRGQARANNVGWRIDYQIISPSLKHRVHAAHIYTGEPFSDHAPLIMDYAPVTS